MPRAMWSGSISFGLVNVPVKMYSAQRDQGLHFSQFAPDGSKIRYKRVAESTGEEVDYDDIQKGYELRKGKFVLVDPEELEQFAPEATRTIDIEDFVELEEIDPIFYERTYYLAPDGKGAARAYALLREAMEAEGRVAIGRVVMRTKEYLAAIRPFEGMLALSTMRFEDEVVDAEKIGDFDESTRPNEREVKMASQIVDSLTTDWDPSKYHDAHRERVLEFLEKKGDGDVVEAPEAAPAGGKVLDLMAALEASVAAAKKGRGGAKPTATELKAVLDEAEAQGTNGDATKKTASRKRSTGKSKSKTPAKSGSAKNGSGSRRTAKKSA